jgi:hypothetical protein
VPKLPLGYPVTYRLNSTVVRQPTKVRALTLSDATALADELRRRGATDGQVLRNWG